MRSLGLWSYSCLLVNRPLHLDEWNWSIWAFVYRQYKFQIARAWLISLPWTSYVGRNYWYSVNVQGFMPSPGLKFRSVKVFVIKITEVEEACGFGATKPTVLSLIRQVSAEVCGTATDCLHNENSHPPLLPYINVSQAMHLIRGFSYSLGSLQCSWGSKHAPLT